MTNTNPVFWFLSSASLPPSWGPAYTSYNKAEALIDGLAYMYHLNARLSAMSAGDYFHLTGWRVTPTQKLLGATSQSSTILSQVQTLIASQVTTRAMIWYFPFSGLGV